MANKELTARIKLDTRDAESKLRRLDTLIKSINKAVTGNANTNKLESSLTKRVIQAEKAKQATLKTEMAQEKLTQEVAKTYIAEEQVNQALAKTAIAQERVKQAASKTAQEIGKEYVAEEKVNQALAKTTVSEERVKQATIGTQIAKQKLIAQHAKTQDLLEKIKASKEQVKQKTTGIVAKIREWANNQRQVNVATKNTNSALDTIGGKLKSIAATYLGIMGVRAVTNTSDTITSAENRLNALNGGDAKATQLTLDKVYASAQKVRTGYSDMIANVSKSMTLAGDAFQGNVDNAIRFQEIMAEAYTLGGASAQEQSTSMYQMIQALGSGTLAGDELRSVREGAPLAYKAIEEFAQGIYNTEESLKDLASQGKITSEMVVAAIMNSGSKMDKLFKDTSITFAQAWDNIKNAALKSFEPVLQRLSKALNNFAKSGAFDVIAKVLLALADVVNWVFSVFEKFFKWCANNWSWLKYVVIGVVVVLAAYLTYLAWVSVSSAIKSAIAWVVLHWQLVLIIGIIAILVVFIVWLANTTVTGCEFMVIALLAVAAAILLIGIISGNVFLIILAGILALVVIFILLAEEICYWVSWAAGWIVNIILGAVAFILALIMAIATSIYNIVAFIVNAIHAAVRFIYTLVQWVIGSIVNITMALANVISAVCQNIGIAFNNAWYGALESFWDFIASCVEGIDWLAKPLEKIAKLFGKSFDAGSFAADIRAKADNYANKQKEYVDVSEAWSKGMNTMKLENMSEQVSKGWNTLEFASVSKSVDDVVDFVSEGFVDPNEWAEAGGNFGAGITEWVDNLGNSAKNSISKLTSGSITNDNINGAINPNYTNSLLPSASDPKYDVTGAYKDPTAEELLKGIDDNTGKMADSMDLAEEDLDYLRRIADMEWKKEFTTATINFEVTNNNNLNNEEDIYTLAVALRDVVVEDLEAVANGVYG